MIERPKFKTLLPLLSIFIIIVVGSLAAITKHPSFVANGWFVLILFGLYMAVDSIVYSYTCYKSKHWPQTYFIVKDERVSKRLHKGTTSFAAYANLEYDVNGIKYIENSRDDYNEIEFKTEDDALRYLNSLKIGSDHFIYYNPKNPRQALLKPGINFRSILAIMVGFGLSYLGAASYMGIIQW